MKLYFLRHGLAGQRNTWEGDDAERPLTEEGKERMEREAVTIARLGLGLELILTSPLVRAYQTAEIVALELDMMDRLVREERLAPGFSPEKLARILKGYPHVQALMLVGHEPDFSTTIRSLIGGGRVVCKKGGLACVDLPNPARLKGDLLWLLPPRVLVL